MMKSLITIQVALTGTTIKADLLVSKGCKNLNGALANYKCVILV
jgi:hypothetical protein